MGRDDVLLATHHVLKYTFFTIRDQIAVDGKFADGVSIVDSGSVVAAETGLRDAAQPHVVDAVKYRTMATDVKYLSPRGCGY